MHLPKLSESRDEHVRLILERHKKLKPVCKRSKEEFYTVKEPLDPMAHFNTSYNWDPKPDKKGTFTKKDAIKPNFPCGYYGFFKPSVEEVLTQTPASFVESYTHYWIDNSTIEIDKSGEFHTATVYFGHFKEIEGDPNAQR